MRVIGFAVVLALTAILAPLAAEQQGGGCTGLAFCKGGRTTGGPGKSSDGERVADGFVVATKPHVIYTVSQTLRAAASVSPRHRKRPRSLRTSAQRWWFVTSPCDFASSLDQQAGAAIGTTTRPRAPGTFGIKTPGGRV